MGITPNIGLHQWAGTDQFLQEEFNEDFRKLDGAVGGLLQSEVMVPLLRTIITEAVGTVEFDLSRIELSQYCELRIRTWGLSTIQTTTVCAVLNGDRGDGHYTSGSTGGISGAGRSIVLSRATPSGRPGGWEATVFLCSNGVFMESIGLAASIAADCYRERSFGCTTAASTVTGDNLTTLTLVEIPTSLPAGSSASTG